MAEGGWIEPPERPDERAVARLRDVCRSEPRIASMWLTGARFKHQDGRTENDGTKFVVVLDPPIGEDVHDEQIEILTKQQIEIMTKLDAAWRPSGRRSVWFPTVPIGVREKRGLPIYAKP
jgi:hypothetical protein